MDDLDLDELHYDDTYLVHSEPEEEDDSFMQYQNQTSSINQHNELIDLDQDNSLTALDPISAPPNQDEAVSWPDCDSVVVLIAVNEAESELVNSMIVKAELALKANQEKQKEIFLKQQMLRESKMVSRKKVPVIQYLPPYFKDEHFMCPPLSDEAKSKLKSLTSDPLQKEEKKWSTAELKKLRSAVKASMLAQKLQSLYYRREIIQDKIKASGQETSSSEVARWKEELEVYDRKINYESSRPDDEILVGDYRDVDWSKIANVDFDCCRTASSVRLKWMNEQSPQWNTSAWSKEEVKKLKAIRESGSGLVSWAVVADKLGTRRTPWMCFEKYKSDVATQSKEWTPEEDEKLIALVKLFTVNGVVQWEKVVYNMPGRQRQHVRTRYTRTLDRNVNHGRWSDEEDMLLMGAVSRLGAKDWSLIAKTVTGRTDVQCRERWLHVLDKRCLNTHWSMEEDEKLLYAVSVLGRGKWTKCAQLLGQNRTAKNCRDRFQSLIALKIKLCSANGILSQDMLKSTKVSEQKEQRIRMLYRKFSQDENEKDDELGKSLLEEIDELTNLPSSAHFKDNSRVRRDKTVWEILSAEERQLVEEDMRRISEKYQNSADEGNPVQLIDMVPLVESDVKHMMRRHEYDEKRRRRKADGTLTPKKLARGRKETVRKLGRNKLLLAEPVPEITEFAGDVPEAERVVHMTEALCQIVRKHDQHQWNQDMVKTYRESGTQYALQAISQGLKKYVPKAAAALKNGEAVPPDCTLSPNLANMALNSMFELVRPHLTRKAHIHFHRSNVSCKDEEFKQPFQAGEAYTMFDRLNINLSKQVTESEEYIDLKARMRSILLEPARLVHVTEGETEEGRRRREAVNQDLIERELEEQTLREIGSLRMDCDVFNYGVTDEPDEGVDEIQPLVLPPIEKEEEDEDMSDEEDAESDMDSDDVIEQVMEEMLEKVSKDVGTTKASSRRRSTLGRKADQTTSPAGPPAKKAKRQSVSRKRETKAE